MERRRRVIAGICVAVFIAATTLFAGSQQSPSSKEQAVSPPATTQPTTSAALDALQTLKIKGRAPKTGYSRAQFSDGWQAVGGCDMRNYILARDLENEELQSLEDCTVQRGTLNDPYTGKTIMFARGASSSSKVQIDHVVALSDAWQKGAQQLTREQRFAFANDPLNLLAVDGQANNSKGDSDAASWLPPNKVYRCQYIARQIAVKQKYVLWLTQAEYDAMDRVLQTCPGQALPVVMQAAQY